MLLRKLFRDIRSHWAQFAAVAAVVLCAMTVYVALQTAYYSMYTGRDAYYARTRMADFFVHLEKAPASALNDAAAVPGVQRVRGRIVEEVSLDVEGNDNAVFARLISMPLRRDNILNDIHMVSGTWFPGVSATEAIVSQRFFEENN